MNVAKTSDDSSLVSSISLESSVRTPSPFWFVSAWTLQHLAWPLGRFLLHVFVHLKVDGSNNVHAAIGRAKEKGVGIIFAMNHTDELDSIALLAGIRPLSGVYPMLYTARPAQQYKGSFWGWRKILFERNWFLYAWGAFPVIPGSKNYKVALAMFEELLKQRHSLAFYPEGKVTRDEFRGEARGGITYLAEETGAIIVPVFINGFFKMRRTGDFWRRKRHASITYGTPFTIDEIEPSSEKGETRYRAVAESVMDRVYALGEV